MQLRDLEPSTLTSETNHEKIMQLQNCLTKEILNPKPSLPKAIVRSSCDCKNCAAIRRPKTLNPVLQNPTILLIKSGKLDPRSLYRGLSPKGKACRCYSVRISCSPSPTWSDARLGIRAGLPNLKSMKIVLKIGPPLFSYGMFVDSLNEYMRPQLCWLLTVDK